MGGPTTAIALEELGHMGADTFIRVGSCGTYQESVDCGDVIISTGIFRAGGTANNYLPPEFPAVPDFYVTRALVQAAAAQGVKVHLGPGSAGDALFACDGTATQTKPEWCEAAFQQGQENAIRIALEAMNAIAQADAESA
jgi:uridine phosphorylase